MIYFLVCHRHIFCLYHMESDAVAVLGMDHHWESLVNLLVDRKAEKVMVVDNWQGHILKIENANRSLLIHEYWQWYWQKWCHIRQNALFASVGMLRRYNSILIAASPSQAHLTPLLEKLDQCSITSTMYSYPLALILRIYALYSPEWAALPPPLLVIVDGEGHVLLAFLLKGSLVFVRQHLWTCPEDTHGMGVPIGPKNIIMDTLRYLEKIFDINGISPIFFLENSILEETLRALFPNGTFHMANLRPEPLDFSTSSGSSLEEDWISKNPQGNKGEHGPWKLPKKAALQISLREVALPNDDASPPLTLVSSAKTPAFDPMILVKIPRGAMMHLKGGILQRSWVRRLAPYLRLINVFAILVSVYSMYTALCLMNCNQKMGQRLDELHKSFKKIQWELSQMPISSDPIVKIQDLRKQSEKQHKDLIQHFALLEHVLNDRCLIRMISISPKKTRLSLQIIDPTMLIDDLIDMGQNALADFCVTMLPSTTSSLLVVETKSPFFYEKTNH